MPPVAPRRLVCFALPQEKRFVILPPGAGVELLVTGMGTKNAVESVRSKLERGGVSGVWTCGFAGGLNPALRHGDIVWDVDEDFSSPGVLERGAGVRGRFHCSPRIAVTAGEKARLRKETGADAVEMESGEIRALCRARGIPSATIRAISDVADEDMPLDFNALATADQRMNYLRLAAALVVRPTVIPRLIRFQSQITAAARSLGDFLNALLASTAPNGPGGGTHRSIR